MINTSKLVKELSKKAALGQGTGPEFTGGANVCVCPSCGHEVAHAKGAPCNETKCPECGTAMTGKGAVGDKTASKKANPSAKVEKKADIDEERVISDPSYTRAMATKDYKEDFDEFVGTGPGAAIGTGAIVGALAGLISQRVIPKLIKPSISIGNILRGSIIGGTAGGLVKGLGDIDILKGKAYPKILDDRAKKEVNDIFDYYEKERMGRQEKTGKNKMEENKNPFASVLNKKAESKKENPFASVLKKGSATKTDKDVENPFAAVLKKEAKAKNLWIKEAIAIFKDGNPADKLVAKLEAEDKKE